MKQESIDKLKAIASQAGQREIIELLHEAYNLGLDDEFQRTEAAWDKFIGDIQSGEYRKAVLVPEQGEPEVGGALGIPYLVILILALMFLLWVLQNQ